MKVEGGRKRRKKKPLWNSVLKIDDQHSVQQGNDTTLEFLKYLESVRWVPQEFSQNSSDGSR